MLKRIIKEYYLANKTDCIMIIIFLLVGIVAGLISMLIASQETMETLKSVTKNTFDIACQTNANASNIAYNGLKNNIYLLGIMTLVTVTVIGKYGIYVITIAKGLALGVYAILLINIFGIGYGIVAILLAIVLVNLIYIPAYIYLAVAFVVFNFELFKTRRDSINGYIIYKLLAKVFVSFCIMASSIAVEQLITPVLLKMYSNMT